MRAYAYSVNQPPICVIRNYSRCYSLRPNLSVVMPFGGYSIGNGPAKGCSTGLGRIAYLATAVWFQDMGGMHLRGGGESARVRCVEEEKVRVWCCCAHAQRPTLSFFLRNPPVPAFVIVVADSIRRRVVKLAPVRRTLTVCAEEVREGRAYWPQIK